MRIFVAALAMAMLFLAAPAHAQNAMSALGKAPSRSSFPKDTGPPPIKANEKAYKATLELIPDKKPVDPWGTVRASEPTKGQGQK
jgi:hypothetical protein